MALPSVASRARPGNGRVCKPATPNRLERGTGRAPKRPEKIQKTAFFATSNRPYLGTTGVSVLRLEHLRGTRTGEIPCCGSGPEPVRGLRWGVFGFASAVAVLTLSSDPADAAPYAAIVVDANSGNVLHSTNPDARRHPASLTKIMTLYLLFEQLEAGKLKLDSQLKVSEHAASQSPTKLGLKAGSTIQVEDAIKGIVTRSANDASVVVAEAIAGDEDDFAELMTQQGASARHEPHRLQERVRPAGRRAGDDRARPVDPRARRSRSASRATTSISRPARSRFRGQWISNHNRLLGRVEGVDGIKTGYIRASGFNLVTSVHRGNRYVVAVVMGGGSAGSRDARMRELISEHDRQGLDQAHRADGRRSRAEANGRSRRRPPKSKPRPSPRSTQSRAEGCGQARARRPSQARGQAALTRSRAPHRAQLRARRGADEPSRPVSRPSVRRAGRHRLDRADPAGPGEDRAPSVRPAAASCAAAPAARLHPRRPHAAGGPASRAAPVQAAVPAAPPPAAGGRGKAEAPRTARGRRAARAGGCPAWRRRAASQRAEPHRCRPAAAPGAGRRPSDGRRLRRP